MITELLILQFIAHLFADFSLQPQSWCDRKVKNWFTRFHFYHIIIVFITSYLLSFDLDFVVAAGIIAVIHGMLDSLKSYLLAYGKFTSLFFADQFLHLFVIVGVVLGYYYFHGIHFIIDFETQVLAIVAGFVLCAKPANVVIKYLFNAFAIDTPDSNSRNEEDKSLPNAGKLIGITERFLTLALILIGQYEAVGLIIAAKSILRYRAAQKSEYVLIGTLLSFGIATFTGILIGCVS